MNSVGQTSGVPEKERPRPVGPMAVIGLLAAVGMLLVPIPFHGRIWAALGDVAHGPLFAVLTIGVLFLWHRFDPLDSFGREWVGRMALVAVCVFLAGVIVEFAQIMTGRSAAMHDAVANGLGVIAGVALYFAALNARYHADRRWVSLTAAGVAMIMIGMALARPVSLLLDIVDVQRSFPLLGSFEREMELTRWYFDDCRCTRTDQNVTDGKHALRILAERAPYPAATLYETVTDWSNVQTLELDVTLSHSYPKPLEFVVKVVDSEHRDWESDTSRKIFRIEPGKTSHLVLNREEIVDGPDERSLDLSHIKFVSLAMVAPEVATFVDVDRVLVTK
ncbi:VanZ family protein [Rhodopirellula sallentina]|uniref:VanZ like protein n=1 Tax=Rhodopirellula sallentina SM41 TaxID=1263870 RepID=M5U3D5_9BACT|nr:VanZ like protein [Rhodopirellula sallentina]EMI55764.1 VanZ like protein [Rhodopirellula sallentina SM41]